MTTKSMVAMIAAGLLLSLPSRAQSPADLLQKGIYAQETAGDLDGAIQIFRQVANSANKSIAAQAQYQLVLCMLQRGDRAGAARELETLTSNFPDQPELVGKARKLLPGGAALLPAPWGEAEGSQLNIKRDGVNTGEYLFYSVDPAVDRQGQPISNQQSLRWELDTQKSRRSVLVTADRASGQPIGRPSLTSNDTLGDPAAEPLAGPAVDIQQSVFGLRRLPLAVGYKTTLATLPFTLGSPVQKDVELAVTAIEPVAVTAGKFRCYKVSFGSIGQTLWIGVEGARPLVKFKAGNVKAELVKIWGPENFLETMSGLFRESGWKVWDGSKMGPGPDGRAMIQADLDSGKGQYQYRIDMSVKKIYTPPAEIPEALRADLSKACVPESIQMRVIGGQQAVSCIDSMPAYRVWIRSESASIALWGSDTSNTLGAYRWEIDHILATAKRIP
jgi:hypothetical protein